jgi:hypothetical protein
MKAETVTQGIKTPDTLTIQHVASTKRSLITDTINDICTQLPTTDDYDKIRSEFNYIHNSLSYTAPEILNRLWLNIHTSLQKYVPISDNSEMNPPWLNDIKQIWIKNNQKYCNIDNATIKNPSYIKQTS